MMLKRSAAIVCCRIIFLLMTCTTAMAQSRATLAFRDTAFTARALDAVLSNYRIVVADDGDFTELGDGTEITIQYHGAHTYTLRDSRILSENYRLTTRDARGVSSVPVTATDFDGRYYISSTVSATDACALSTFAGQYFLFFREGAAETFVEPLSLYVPGADPTLYVSYAPADLKAVNAGCGGGLNAVGTPPTTMPNTGGPEAGGCFVTELAIVCDYSLFQKYGSVNGAQHRTINITNLTKTDYKISNGLTDNVDFKIVEHYISTCDTCNPWTPTTNIFQNLDSLLVRAPSILTNPYDLAQVWFANPSFGGGTVGLAYLAVVCDPDYRYNAILDYSTSLANMRNLNSHEIGHNFSYGHDTAGSPTIMAPTVNGSSTWSAASVGSIGGYIASSSAGCLAACPSVPALCDTLGVAGIAIRKDSLVRTITVKWTGTPTVGYMVRLYRYATGSWTPYTTVAAGVDSAVFAVPIGLCAAKWKAEIIPVCPVNISGGSKMIVFNYRGAPGLWTGVSSSAWFTPGNWCGGAVPTLTTDVFVPGSVPFAPVLGNSTAISSFTLQGGNMTVQTGAVLAVD